MWVIAVFVVWARLNAGCRCQRAVSGEKVIVNGSTVWALWRLAGTLLAVFLGGIEPTPEDGERLGFDFESLIYGVGFTRGSAS